MIPIRSLCAECLGKFRATLKRHHPSGVMQCHCAHHSVALTASVEDGVVLNWALFPAAKPVQETVAMNASLDPLCEDSDLLAFPPSQSKKH